jgi:hypothetical protein
VKVLLAWFLSAASFAWSQDVRPRLELEPRLNLNGGGFQKVSGSMTAGMGMEDTYLSWHVSGSYDAARKANDGTDNNTHGNIRSVGGSFFGRPSGGWLFGADGSYASLRTKTFGTATNPVWRVWSCIHLPAKDTYADIFSPSMIGSTNSMR